ncbi:hypothetical protein SAMN05216390_10668 [Lachnospiraceae bacterium KH1T2]|nr:hypothetical protein SAMN05216390_10668 [Lachnospiraceae bacterium KH1T2]
MSEVHQEYQSLKEEMSKIDTQRGGGVNGLKGFYAEQVNAAIDNVNRINSGTLARQVVIDNNGDADAIIKYSNGRFGRAIQYKSGYQFSKHKEFLSSGKYDGMIYAVNYDHSLFFNEKQLEELSEIAKKHNIKIVQASVSDSEMKVLAEVAFYEGKVRDRIGLNKAPKITIELYVDSKEAKYQFDQIIEKQTQVNSFIANQTSSFLNEDFGLINRVGTSQALSAAQFAAAFSVAKNAISIIKEEKEFGEAAKSVVKDASTAAVIGYATGSLTEFANIEMGDAALLVNGTIQVSKQIVSYVNGEIDEERLIQNVTETTTLMVAAHMGKSFGGTIGSIGGPVGIFIGQFIGEMVTTAICTTVIDTIHREKKVIKYHNKMLGLAHRAENEIREAQERLFVLVNEDNKKMAQVLNEGYEKFLGGIVKYDYNLASLGLVEIGEQFGIKAEKIKQGHIEKGNIFRNKNRVIRMG